MSAAIPKNQPQNQPRPSRGLAALLALVFSAAPALLQAQQDRGGATVLEEIVVTATKRASSIQDVPFSINAQTAADIRRSGAQSLEDVSRSVAGLMIQNLGPGQSQVAIRGVSAGQIVRDQPGVKEQVGVYLDESVISLSLFTPDLDLYDLNRVETLRGPQGTLFGSGSIGGTIRYITNQPNADKFESSMEAGMSAINGGGIGGQAKAMANVPLIDGTAALRLVGYYTEFAGFIDARREGGGMDKNVNSGSRSGGRIALFYQLTPALSITPRLIYQKIDMEGFNRQEVYNLYANPYTTTRPALQLGEREQFLRLDEGFEDETRIADLTLNYDFGALALTAVSSYTNRDILVSRDASALTGSVSVDFKLSEKSVLLPSNLRDTTEVEQFTQELRLGSADERRLQWLVGAFYSDTERFYEQFLPTPGYDAFLDAVEGAGASEKAAAGVGPQDSPYFSQLPYELKQLAAFAEASYALTDDLQITIGGRYYDFEEERSATLVGVFAATAVNQINKTKSSGFTPRVLLRYDLNDALTLNAQASKGFRLGGVNDPLNRSLCEESDIQTFGAFQSYDDETLWNYEGGVKLRTERMSLNAAAFYTDISNLQVTLDAGSCSSRISFNVAKAHTMGLELELKAQPMENLDLSFAGSYVESKFDSTVVDKDGKVLGGVRDGNRLPSVPKFNMGATATYYFPFNMVGKGAEGYLSATFQRRSSIFTQPSDQEPGAGTFASGLAFGGATGKEETVLDLELDSYQTLNLSAGVLMEGWEVSVYINNLTDENANLSFDRERGGRARLGFRTNQPRTFGTVFRASFF